MPKEKEVVVNLTIPEDSYVALYAGTAKDVIATSTEGLRVRFPGKILHKFLTHNGIHGTFRIRFDANNKFLAIEQVGWP